MKIFDNKTIVISILSFLTIIIIALSIYMVYILNNEEECFCEPLEDLVVVDEKVEEEQLENIFHIEIKGAVENPGVYELSDGSIINDAILMAGGFKEDAYTNNINLSKKVTDELVIYVFTNSEYKKNKTSETKTNTNNSYDISEDINNNVSIITSGGTSSDNSSNNLVNINLATIEELITLPGIGESKATSIINYRDNNGLFKSIEDLKNVNGIGDTTFEKLKAYITV